MKAFLIGCSLLVLASAPALAGVKEGVDAYIAGDYAKAIAEWRGPAAAGDPDAQFNMGQAYNLGHGVAVDKAAAMEWFRKAAASGHAQAQAAVGIQLFQAGKRDEALAYLKKAADQGEPKAQYIVATAYFNGDSLPKDWVRAYALMLRSKAQGIGAAATSLAQMEQAIPEGQKQSGAALARELERSEQLKAVDASAPARTMMTPAPRASTPAATAAPIAQVSVPKSEVYSPPAPKVAEASPPAPAPASKPAAVKPVVEKPKPVITAAPGGGWKVQLGAFSTAAAAKTAWERISGASPGLRVLTPIYTPVGAVTRLQAGPLASRPAAQQACSTVQTACFPVAP